jgi:hypothetical protein
MAGLFDNNYGMDLSSLGSYGNSNNMAAPSVSSSPVASNNPVGGDWTSVLKNLLSGALNQSSTTNGITTQSQGWAAPAVAGAGALLNGFLGMQQYGLAQDAQKEQTRQFNANFQNQRSLTNTQLEDRQRARVAAGGNGAYQSVSDYMTKNGV